MSSKMRAVVYDGPFKVSVQEVEKPKIQHPCDVIVRSKFYRPLSRPWLCSDGGYQSRRAASAEGLFLCCIMPMTLTDRVLSTVIFTCTRDALQPNPASSSDMRTWAS